MWFRNREIDYVFLWGDWVVLWISCEYECFGNDGNYSSIDDNDDEKITLMMITAIINSKRNTE